MRVLESNGSLMQPGDTGVVTLVVPGMLEPIYVVREQSGREWSFFARHLEAESGAVMTKERPESLIPVESVPAGQQLVAGPRQDDYGHPIVNFRRIARIWSGILDIEVTEEQVALCMIGVKMAREVNKAKDDNQADIDGYNHCLRLVKQAKSEQADNA